MGLCGSSDSAGRIIPTEDASVDDAAVEGSDASAQVKAGHGHANDGAHGRATGLAPVAHRADAEGLDAGVLAHFADVDRKPRGGPSGGTSDSNRAGGSGAVRDAGHRTRPLDDDDVDDPGVQALFRGTLEMDASVSDFADQTVEAGGLPGFTGSKPGLVGASHPPVADVSAPAASRRPPADGPPVVFKFAAKAPAEASAAAPSPSGDAAT